jgi:hypothetical protein
MARTLLGVTFNRFAASAVLMSFTVQSITFRRNGAPAQQFLLTSEDPVYIVSGTKTSGLASALTLASPYTANS